MNNQATILLSLFEVTNLIENELKDKDFVHIKTKIILFLRKDIFDYILKETRGPDKIILNKQEIDWSNFPEQLKKLIEKRSAHILEIPTRDNISFVWNKYFSLKLSGGTTVFNRIQNVCLPRPQRLVTYLNPLLITDIQQF